MEIEHFLTTSGVEIINGLLERVDRRVMRCVGKVPDDCERVLVCKLGNEGNEGGVALVERIGKGSVNSNVLEDGPPLLFLLFNGKLPERIADSFFGLVEAIEKGRGVEEEAKKFVGLLQLDGDEGVREGLVELIVESAKLSRDVALGQVYRELRYEVEHGGHERGAGGEGLLYVTPAGFVFGRIKGKFPGRKISSALQKSRVFIHPPRGKLVW